MGKTNISTNVISFEPNRVANAFAYIESKWTTLTKNQTVDEGTLVGLPYPYVVPSNDPESAFQFDEMYYWDSYFIAQGLFVTGQHELAEGMLDNLIYLAKKFHMIPNGSRYYFTSRSQPPFLTSYILDIYEKNNKDKTWLKEYLWVAEKEYNNVWVSDRHPHWRRVHKGLSRYYDFNLLHDLAEAEGGWDMTTRYNRECLSYIPVDLNSLLYKYELDFAKGYEILGDKDASDLWKEHAQKRKMVITSELWDDDKEFFFDLNYTNGHKSNVLSLAAYYTMWSGLASKEQAKIITDKLSEFLHEGGLTATSRPDEILHEEVPSQWAYPNGWSPLHWITIKGLQNYGYNSIAQDIARRWLQTNLVYFERYGVFREAYNVVDHLKEPKAGVYPPQLGFGWTNAVFVALAKEFLSPDELAMV